MKKELGTRLDLATLLKIFEKCNVFDDKMKSILEMLTVNYDVIDKFTTEPKRILDALFKRWKIINVIKLVWEQNFINGNLKKEFHLLQEVVQNNLSVILDCMGDSCLLYTSPSPRDGLLSRMPSSA